MAITEEQILKLGEIAAKTKVYTRTQVDELVATLTGATHFIGVSTTELTNGGTETPTGTTTTTLTAGDIAIYDGKEFIWDGAKWAQFGVEGVYAIADQVYTKTAADALLADKVDTATYTADKATFATKGEVTAEATARGEADTALGNRIKAIEDLNLAAGSTYATKDELNTGLAGKVDNGTYATDKATFALKADVAATIGTVTEGKTVVGMIGEAQAAAENHADTAIAALDATVKHDAGADGIAVTVTQTDGVLTAVTASIAANTYDAHGAAAAAQAAAATDATTKANQAKADAEAAAKTYTDTEVAKKATLAEVKAAVKGTLVALDTEESSLDDVIAAINTLIANLA